MINKNVINILLFVISVVVFLIIIIPGYNGLGFNNLYFYFCNIHLQIQLILNC